MAGDTIAELASRLLDLDEGELTAREKSVIERAAKRLAVSRNVNIEFRESATLGQRVADRVTRVGGSWAFIISFLVFVVIWTSINTWLAIVRPFDPYPFVFLNLILSLLAAVQAPIIIMSQNRQAAKDRLAAAHDYEVNLKAEIEIAALHQKLDDIRSSELALLMEKAGVKR